MINRKILFIAYLFPPVVGKGLPGVQRTVKFLRHLPQCENYVLTLKTERYPNFFTLETSVALPIAGETIIRTTSIDLLEVLHQWRNAAKALFKRLPSTHAENRQSPAPVGGAPEAGAPKNFFAQFKDALSEVLTFPDFASSWIAPAVWEGVNVVRNHNIDVVFATGLPWTSLLVGGLIKKIANVKLVIDFRDPWVNNPFSTDKGPIRRKAERYVEKRLVEWADVVSLNTEALRNDFLQRYSYLTPDKFIVLYNGYDTVDFQKIDSQALRKQEINDNLILAHAGFLYGIRDPRSIFNAIEQVRRQAPAIADKIKFIQIGEIHLNYDLPTFVNEKGLQTNYEHLGQLPYNVCLQSMALSDILVIIQPDTQTQIPSKLYEYIYLDKPILVITHKGGALYQLVNKYQFGEAFEPEDVNGIAQYLIDKLAQKEKGVILHEHYKNKALFDVKAIAGQLRKVIEEIVSN
jgi:glycosyltransferase involved in cell wall biosynthesis